MCAVKTTLSPLLFAFLATTVLFLANVSAQDGGSKGAIIIVSVEGDVKVKKVSSGELLPQDNVAAGKTIFDGHTVITGDASKAVLFLSNGTITTITEKSDLTFEQFTQEKFEKTDDKLSDLPAEPSNSTTKLKLAYGDMVFDVKKLNPGSSFDIGSPVGSAGIRGTAGGMNVQVDDQGSATGGVVMTNGSINFTDLAGNSIPVIQGQQLGAAVDANGNAAETQTADAPPEALAEVNETQQESAEQSSDVTVSDAGNAQEEANQAAQEESAGSQDEGGEDSEEDSGAPSGDSGVDSDEATQQNLEINEEVDELNEEAANTTESEPTSDTSGTETDLAKAISALDLPDNLRQLLESYSEDLQWKVVGEQSADARFILEMGASADEITRFYLHTSQTRTTLLALDEPSHAHSLIAHPLTSSEIQQALGYSNETRQVLLQESSANVQILLSMEFQESDLSTLLGYSQQLKDSLLATSDAQFIQTLIQSGYGESTQLSLLQDTRFTADLLLGQSLQESEIQQFYGYSPLTRTEIVTGIEPENISPLLAHSLDGADITSLVAFNFQTQESFIGEPTTRLQTLLSFNLTQTEASTLFGYSSSMRQSLADTDDGPLVKTLLGFQQSESELAVTLASYLADDEPVVEADPNDISDLLIATRANGNEEIVPKLYELGDGKITPELLATGQLGNDLLTDISIDGSLDSSRFFNAADAVDNVFYSEVGLLVDTWVIPGAQDRAAALGTLGQIVAGNKVTLLPGALDLDQQYQAGQTEFFITAAAALALSGDVDFTAAQKAAQDSLTLTLLTAQQFELAENSKISFTDGSLQLGSQDTTEFQNVSMEAGGDLTVSSLEDLLFQDVSLTVPAGDNIHLAAANELAVNGLQFSAQAKEIYMQATTIDLQNVFFPGGSTAHLQSRDGGIDGIYPTFPTGDPANLLGNRQVGRVNFIQNVGYDQTVINNRATFDQFKNQILITPLTTGGQ